jgi:glycosyltransferase involved in cell wall biosynthesis
MRLADLFVLPSLFETFSTVSIEALASGVPILATYCGGPEEFIGEAVGRLVPPGDSSALYLALRDMLSNLANFNPARLAQYAVEHFSYERVGAQLDSIYAEM